MKNNLFGISAVSAAVMLFLSYSSKEKATVTDIDGNVYRTIQIGNKYGWQKT